MVSKRLKEFKNDEYRDFQANLVPNIPKKSIIGVKTPEMRKIAKEIYGTKEAEDFLKDLPHRYYEENLVHFFLIALIKDFDECIKAVDTFLPYVDCWPVSDQSSPAVFKKHHDKLVKHVKRWIDSDHVYTSRFGMRILMNEYLGDDFKEEYPKWIAGKKGDDYYLKMMKAWYFATALAKRYDETISFIEDNSLEPWTHNKAIQKAVESYRVSDEHKAYLKTLKVK
ncbi:MAG: DNA alkylation repair protein [Lachnospiraceae bacterium]|nr:DNA alkylation repair protein [Lachnospiraceae bacterium]